METCPKVIILPHFRTAAHRAQATRKKKKDAAKVHNYIPRSDTDAYFHNAYVCGVSKR